MPSQNVGTYIIPKIDLERLNRLVSELNNFNAYKTKPKPLKELFGKPKPSGLNEFCKKTYKDYSGTKE